MKTANVPPVRKRGPRESIKENIEAGEFASLILYNNVLLDEVLLNVGELMDHIQSVYTEISSDIEYPISERDCI